MRRSAAEWLLVPLFLLPVLVGVGLTLLARASYLTERERLRREGEIEVRRRIGSMDGGEAAWHGLLLREEPAPLTLKDDRVLLRRDEGEGAPFTCEVSADVSASTSGPDRIWRISNRLPVGLRASRLADPETRLRLETTKSVASREPVDELTTLLAELLATPDPERLRVSPLALTTKLFVVRRWRQRDPALAEGLRRTERGLETGLAVMRWFDGRGEPPAPGVHPVGDVTVYAGRHSLMARLDPPSAASGRMYSFRSEEDDPFEIAYLPLGPMPSGGEILWEGRLETPLAGRWRLVAIHGSGWWEVGTFRRWAAPVGAGLLAYLLIPIALLVSIRRRRRLDEARRRFITELAHDLRTPLTSVRLYAEMLEGGRVPDADRDEYVAVLARESGRLSSLLANLLDLSRLDRGRRSFESRPVEVARIVADAVRDFVALEPDREKDVNAAGPGSCSALADPEALSRALANLLENAGKFTGPGTAIDLRWRGEHDAVMIRVADEGPGIPEDERSRLFERFARGEVASRDGIPGTGLGLSLVRELVEGCGGTVRHVDSSRGATFEIRLRKANDGG